MKKILFLQTAVTLGAAALCWVISGRDAAVSAFLTGLAFLVPNALFAVNLLLFSKSGAVVGAAVFLAGEIIKLMASGALFALGAILYRDFVWPAAVATLAVFLLSSVLGLLIRE